MKLMSQPPMERVLKRLKPESGGRVVWSDLEGLIASRFRIQLNRKQEIISKYFEICQRLGCQCPGFGNDLTGFMLDETVTRTSGSRILKSVQNATENKVSGLRAEHLAEKERREERRGSESEERREESEERREKEEINRLREMIRGLEEERGRLEGILSYLKNENLILKENGESRDRKLNQFSREINRLEGLVRSVGNGGKGRDERNERNERNDFTEEEIKIIKKSRELESQGKHLEIFVFNNSKELEIFKRKNGV